MKKRKKLLLVDDHHVIGDLFRMALDKHQAVFELIGHVTKGTEALDFLDRVQVEVVVMDISLPDQNGIITTQQIKTKYPHIKILALSSANSKPQIIKTLQAGAQGYFLKTDRVAVILAGLEKAVSSAEIVLSPSLKESTMAEILYSILHDPTGLETDFSQREIEVLKLLSDGYSIQEIAENLSLTPRTIEKNRRRIMKKLGTNSIADLTKYAIFNGITTAESLN